ncbi:Acyl carrier protein [Kitasatospora sp. MMS16-BH015]|uniref:acyl carrier protein n=1 Tax=Kitasatospora sp. MMS16-BH015 TaxID=2018025 RepID=UPI000CA0D586|nr:acyl carrier protein [Kitasatospora sp. MMS16-BH015]AUG81612.1 Acyl carrier protein [Kitasatospora sp. MMS16-BH015]
MQTKQQIFEELAALIDRTVEEVDLSSIRPDCTFKDDLDIDSIAKLEILVAIEERWKIKIPEEDGARLTTVQQAIDYLAAATGDGADAGATG